MVQRRLGCCSARQQGGRHRLFCGPNVGRRHSFRCGCVPSVPCVDMRPKFLRPKNRFVIAGSDSLALRLVEELQPLEETVTVIVADASNHFVLRMADLGARIIVGPPHDAQTLLSAGVERATALALLDPDDVDNVHAALTAQDVNPRLRLVIRVYDTDLAARITSLFDNCAALSPGAIAAPAFVDLVRGDGQGQLVWVADRPLTAAAPHAVTEVLATLVNDDAGEVQLLPPPDSPATIVLGAPPIPRLAQQPTLAPMWQALERFARQCRGAYRSVRMIAGSVFSRRARHTLAWFALICTVAAVVFHRGLGDSWIDAVFRSVAVITSAGYDNLFEESVPGWAKLFGAAVMLSGVLMIAVMTAIVVNDLIEVRVAERIGMPITTPHGHVVVCGLGAVGLRIAQQLVAEGHQVIGVESSADPAMLASARRIGIGVVRGEASDEEILRSAGVANASCVVAVTNVDVTNLQVGLACREIAPRARVVLRLFDTDLAERVGKRLGITSSRSVSMLAAPVFATAMLGREVTGVIAHRRRVMLVANLDVHFGSDAVGLPLGSLDRDGELRVLALIRGEQTIWALDPQMWLAPGDTVVVVATRTGLSAALRLTSLAEGESN